MSLLFYVDSNLSEPLASGLVVPQKTDGSIGPQRFRLYLGEPDAAWYYQADSDPGVDPILISIESSLQPWPNFQEALIGSECHPTTPNGYKYRIVASQGSSWTGSTEPTWPTTIGAQVVDNEVTWECISGVHSTSEIKLATTEAGLDSAVGGDSLAIGNQIDGGVGNHVDVWVEAEDATLVAGNDTTLSFKPNPLRRLAA